MHWNNRVVEFDDGQGDKYYEICEVYYDKNDKPIGYCDACFLSETKDGLKEIYERMREAFDLPVINENDLEVKYGPQISADHKEV